MKHLFYLFVFVDLSRDSVVIYVCIYTHVFAQLIRKTVMLMSTARSISGVCEAKTQLSKSTMLVILSCFILLKKIKNHFLILAGSAFYQI